MSKLVFGFALLFVALVLIVGAGAVRPQGPRPVTGLLRILGLALGVIGGIVVLASLVVIIEPGQAGVRHAFGYVDRQALLPGIRYVVPWSSIERYSTREEQFPEGSGRDVETISALSNEQMGMSVEVALRWQMDPQQAPRIYTEIGTEDQIHSVVLNAIRKGVRDGMVQFSINDISQRSRIAAAMERQVDSALVTRPRAGAEAFWIASITAFFLRDLQPPPQVVAAINNKIAQEQQIETERHRVEVARLQSEQQRLLNQTLTAEQLTKQYLEVLHDMRQSNNLVILVPTQGGIPMLNIGDLRRNLKPQ